MFIIYVFCYMQSHAVEWYEIDDVDLALAAFRSVAERVKFGHRVYLELEDGTILKSAGYQETAHVRTA